MVPVGSAMSQEVWLWFSNTWRISACYARLRELELSDVASRGAWGSLLFLFRARTRYFHMCFEETAEANILQQMAGMFWCTDDDIVLPLQYLL